MTATVMAMQPPCGPSPSTPPPTMVGGLGGEGLEKRGVGGEGGWGGRELGERGVYGGFEDG